MLEALPGQLGFPAQKRTPDATGHDMVETRLVFGNQMTAWISHAGIVPSRHGHIHRRSAQEAVGNLPIQCLLHLQGQFLEFAPCASWRLVIPAGGPVAGQFKSGFSPIA
ncbi:MAG: hypothetical protein LAT56_16915 [Wenzhouxiangella sp.]|nr:hypothetical protein [Wenzhouxiangella sp.]